jgi:S-DNA-T family DNA segregation ATPase FtsK/SpoIIIE
MLQRRFPIGYAKAGGIIDKMDRMGYISPFDGSRARQVLITKEQFEEKYGEF